MICTFTPERLWYVEQFVEGLEPIEVSARRFQVELPAVAWLYLYERMLDHVYNVRGQKRSEVKRYQASTLRVIRTELNMRERHPAMREVGMLGWHKDCFPVWREGAEWEPYPNGGDFAVLVPTHRRVQGHRVTLWSPGDPPVHSPLFEEGEHLRFGLQVHGGRIEVEAGT